MVAAGGVNGSILRLVGVGSHAGLAVLGGGGDFPCFLVFD